MRFSTSGLKSIVAVLAVIAALLLTSSLNAYVVSCANTNTVTSKTQMTSPGVQLTNWPTRLIAHGRILELSKLSSRSQNQLITFTDSKTLLPSAISHPSGYASAAQTRARLNSLESLTTSISPSLQITGATSLKTFSDRAIWKTARRFSANALPQSWTTSAKRQERSLKILTTAPLIQSSTHRFSASVAGDISAQWRRRESSWPASSPFSTIARATSAASWTAKLYASARHKRLLNGSTNWSRESLPKRCTNLRRAALSQKTLLIT